MWNSRPSLTYHEIMTRYFWNSSENSSHLSLHHNLRKNPSRTLNDLNKQISKWWSIQLHHPTIDILFIETFYNFIFSSQLRSISIYIITISHIRYFDNKKFLSFYFSLWSRFMEIRQILRYTPMEWNALYENEDEKSKLLLYLDHILFSYTIKAIMSIHLSLNEWIRMTLDFVLNSR